MRLTKRLALVMCCVMLLTACPSSNDLDAAAKASNELAHDVLVANKVVGEFFIAKRISLAQKDSLADKLGQIGEKGEAFNNALIALDKKYPQGTLPPQDLAFVRSEYAILKQLFDELVGELVGVGAEGAVSELKKDLDTIGKVVK